MTEIRHNRPILKYLDNLRRENLRVELVGQLSKPKSEAEKSTPQRLQQPKNEQAYARHLEAFDILPDQSKNAIGQMFDDANSLMEARIEYIQSIGNGKKTGKRKAKYDDAYTSLRAACAAFNIHCKTELRDGKSMSRGWWSKLRIAMGSEWTFFEEIDELVKETR